MDLITSPAARSKIKKLNRSVDKQTKMQHGQCGAEYINDTTAGSNHVGPFYAIQSVGTVDAVLDQSDMETADGSATNYTNFEIGESITDAQSPNEFATAHNAAVAGATIAVETLIKLKSWHMPKNQKITRISGWLSATKVKTTTIALAKWVPDESSASAVTPSAIHEWTVTTSSADADVVERIKETVIDTADVNEGDMLFFMIKADDTGNTFVNLTVEYTDR